MTQRKFYKTFPMEIEAIRYGFCSRQEIIDWLGNKCHHLGVDDEGIECEVESLLIQTYDGQRFCELGDWVILDAQQGQFWTLSHEEFILIYQL